MALVDRRLQRRTIDLGRARVHQPPYTEASNGLENVKRSFDVGAHVCTWSFIGVWNGDQGSQMKYDIVASHDVVYEIAILDCSADDPNFLADISIAESEIADQRSGVVSNHRGGCRSSDNKRFGEMASDKSAGTGYEYLFSSPHSSQLLARCKFFRERRTVTPLERRVVGDEGVVVQPGQFIHNEAEADQQAHGGRDHATISIEVWTEGQERQGKGSIKHEKGRNDQQGGTT